MIVYMYQNNLNGMIYVGKTTGPLEERMEGHLHNKRHSLIDEAIREYGIENFTVRVIAHCDTREELDDYERYWISELDCVYPKGYNLVCHKRKSLSDLQKSSPVSHSFVTHEIYDKI